MNTTDDTPDPLAEATARSHAEERATLAAKEAGADLLMAVLCCAPELLPETLRLAWERVLATGG